MENKELSAVSALPLAKANEIIEAALARGREMGIKPLSVAVLDAGGHLIAFQRSDDASFLRYEIAAGKAYGALALGVGSRWLHDQAETRPHFLEGVSNVSGGKIVAVPGGVLIKQDGAIIAAVGITGDTSDNDEACAVHAVEAAGYTAVAG